MKKIGWLLGILFLAITVFLIEYNSEFFTKTKNNQLLNKNQKLKNKKIILKFAHNLPKESTLHQSSLLFAKKIFEKTNGAVEVKIYPAQILGNDYKMLELARMGEIDILLTPTAKISPIVPSLQYVDLPFLFKDKEQAYYLLDGAVGTILLNDLQYIDLVGITFWENGFKHFTSNSLIQTPKDFKNKNIRIMKSKILKEQFEALGANAIPIDFYKTKQALKDGVVDGQENPLTAIYSMGFHKVQSNLTLSSHGYLGYAFSISKRTFSKLSHEIQNKIIETANEVTLSTRNIIDIENVKLLKKLKQEGMKVHKLTQEQRVKFENATKHLIKQNEDRIGSHVISKAEEMLYNKYNAENKDLKVIGVDVDISMGDNGAGLAIKRGVEIAVAEINENGGVLGKKLLVIAKDHKALSTQGITNIKSFSSDKNVVGVIGGKHSAIIASELPYIEEYKTPYIIPWATATKIVENEYDNNYIFRVSLNDNIVSKFIAQEVSEKYKQPLIVAENSIWGRDGKENLHKELQYENIHYNQSAIIQRGEKNFLKLIQQINKVKPDSLILFLNSEEATHLVLSLKRHKIQIPIISHWGIIGDRFYFVNKNYLKNIDFQFIQTFSFKNANNVAKNLSKRYLQMYKKSSYKEINAPSGVAQAYDATYLLVNAIKKAGSFEREKIQKALENLPPYDGAVRRYTKAFSKNEHESLDIKDVFMAKYGKNGEIIPLTENRYE